MADDTRRCKCGKAFSPRAHYHRLCDTCADKRFGPRRADYVDPRWNSLGLWFLGVAMKHHGGL